MHQQQVFDLCRQHLHRYVRVTTSDGRVHDGFIADVDRHNLTLAIPEGHWADEYSGQSTESMDFANSVLAAVDLGEEFCPCSCFRQYFYFPFLEGMVADTDTDTLTIIKSKVF